MASKPVELALSLSASLARRFAVVVNGVDTNGLPTIQIGAGTAGTQSAFIRVKPVDSIGTDSVGNTQRSFGPHIIQVCIETSTIANVGLLLESAKTPLLGEVMGRGTSVEVYMSANTVAATVATIAAGNLKFTWSGFNADFGLMAAV